VEVITGGDRRRWSDGYSRQGRLVLIPSAL